jgi:deoxycytidylate deaminase
MTCAKQRVTCTLHLRDGTQVEGENRCRNPQRVCPRVERGMKTGEGYELCQSVCQQVGHAEADALATARSFGLDLRGATAHVQGHTYYCMACQHALFAAGVARLVAPKATT